MLFDFFKISFIFVFIIAAVIGVCIGTIRSIEYIEENTYAAKQKIQNLIYGVLLCHIYLLWAGVPIYHLLLSLSIQYTFNCFMRDYPAIKPEDFRFIYGVVGSLINHFLMIKFFFDRHCGVVTIIFCFILVWATPFAFFFSMSATDDVLFVKNQGQQNVKTYAGMLLDYLLNLGKRTKKKL